LVRRDTREKIFVSLDELEAKIKEVLKDIQQSLYNKALQHREDMTCSCTELFDFIKTAEQKPGFIKAMWCGELECEEKLKELAGVSSRCLPFEQEQLSDKCICCGKPAKDMVYWGKAY
jgi:prolyl-tRNA synthetase